MLQGRLPGPGLSSTAMETPQELARRWRERTEVLCALAAMMEHPAATQDLMEVAARWEVMARHAEEREARTVSPSPE
jgi:hypothetical protein